MKNRQPSRWRTLRIPIVFREAGIYVLPIGVYAEGDPIPALFYPEQSKPKRKRRRG